MNTLFLYSLSLNVVSLVGLLIFAWRIMRMQVTPSWTWSLFFTSVAIQAVRTVWGFFYVNQVQDFLLQFPPATLLITYGLGAVQTVLIFAFVVRIYYELRTKFPPVPPKI